MKIELNQTERNRVTDRTKACIAEWTERFHSFPGVDDMIRLTIDATLDELSKED